MQLRIISSVMRKENEETTVLLSMNVNAYYKRVIGSVQVTHICIYFDSPINLLMSLASRALQKPGQLQHVLNRANVIRSFFSPISLSTQQLK